MVQLRISKYPPHLRDEDGNYTVDDWTSVSDVGQEFQGRPLTASGYLSVEDAFVQVARDLLTWAGLRELTIQGIEKHGDISALPKGVAWKENTNPDNLAEGDVLQLAAIEDVVRLNLREVIWCKMSGVKNFYLHFGYDYYMYAGFDGDLPTDSSCPPLYMEPFPSPYR